MSQARLSVILLVDQQRVRSQACLDSVLAQDIIQELEVLLVDCASNHPPLRGADHPQVRLLKPAVPSLGARAEAVRQARAPYVAFLEEHARAQPQWARYLLESLEAGARLVMPKIQCLPTDSYFANLLTVWFMLPFLEPDSLSAPYAYTTNMAADRAVLLALGDELDELMMIEAPLRWKLQALQVPVVMQSKAVIQHINLSQRLAYWQLCFYISAYFMQVRLKRENLSLVRRVLEILATPIIPFWRMRQFLHFARSYPQHIPTVRKGIADLFMMHFTGSLGRSAAILFPQLPTMEFVYYQEVCAPRIPQDMPLTWSDYQRIR